MSALLLNFKKMCVQRVIFGFDDYDPRVVGKTSGCIGQNIEVAKKLDKAGIQIFACYVPGSEGETKYKLNKTVDQIMEVMELPSTSVIEFTSLAPMPGSRAYEQIKYRYWELYGKTDCLDVVDLARVWVQEKVPDLTWEIIEEYKDKLRSEAEKRGIVFGGYY